MKLEKIIATIWITATILAILLATVVLGGCAAGPGTGVPDSIPLIGGTVYKAQAHVDSAERLVKAAEPESNITGKKLLEAASAEHGAAGVELKIAETQLATAEAERTRVEKKYGIVADELTKVKAGWGYRLQVLVARLFWIIVILVGLHYIGGAAALFIPGPFGAGLSVISRLVNPGAWASTIFDNLHFRGKTPSATPIQ
jgi:hypothetical protein